MSLSNETTLQFVAVMNLLAAINNFDAATAEGDT